ncbi:MAG: hypothetical protein KBC24_04265 [Caldisericia bacterium]|nr:hypothetical protein [Caldisericia bacterium]
MKEWLENIRQAIGEVSGEAGAYFALKGRLHGRVTIGDQTRENTVTDAGIRAIARALCSPVRQSGRTLSPVFRIEWFAASTSATPPTPKDTTLGGSVSLRSVEQVDALGKKLVVTNFIGQPEFNFTWRKVGLLLTDSTVFALCGVYEPKTDQVSKTVVWEIEFS